MRMRIAIAAVVLALGVEAAPAAADKAADIIAGTRKAIGARQLDALKTLSVSATVQRNVGAMQMNTDTELLFELPDKYVRADVMSGPMSGTSTVGFIGDKPVQKSGAFGGGGLVIRMGPGPGSSGGAEKLTPEEQEQANRMLLRSMRHDLSRLMLGWFATTHPSVHAQYTYVGEAESPDGKAYVIEAKSDDGFAARLFIDEQTQLPLMVTYKAPQPRIVTAGGRRDGASRPSNEPLSDAERRKMREEAHRHIQEMDKQPPVLVDYTLFFDEWRDVDGIKFPHRIRRAVAGETSEEWSVSKVKVNPRIDPKRFEG
jgi:hypothetical protein